MQNTTLQATRNLRTLLASFLDQYSVEALNVIPESFNNNLFWNIAHVVATQQLLVHKLAGQEMVVPAEYIDSFRKGSRPVRQYTQADIDETKHYLTTTLDRTEELLNQGALSSYKPYTTSTGTVIDHEDVALQFNLWHEGLHMGYCLSIRKFL